MKRRWVPVSANGPACGGQFLREVGVNDSYMSRVYRGRVAGRVRVVSRTFRGKLRDAKIFHAEFVAEVSNTSLSARSPKATPSTLNALADEWLALIDVTVEEKTLKSYTDALSNYVLPTLGSTPLKNITPRDLDHLFVAMEKGALPKPLEGARGWRGKPLSTRTVRMTRGVLRQVFERARKWGYVKQNPVRDTSAPRYEPKYPKEVLTVAEYAAFLNAAIDEHYYVYLRLLFECGLRPGEAAGLRWEDLDLEAGLLNVTFSVGLGKDGPKTMKAPKTKSSVRSVQMAPSLVGALRAHRVQQAELGHDGLGHVVTNTLGEKMAPNNFSRKVLDRISRKAGLKKRVVLYSGRHTTGTLMHESGMPLKVISTVLGHTDVNTTAGTYVHESPNLTRRVMGEFWEHLNAQHPGPARDGTDPGTMPN